jgi:hypothetical protein
MTTGSPANKQPLHSITSTSPLHPWQITVAKKDITENAHSGDSVKYRSADNMLLLSGQTVIHLVLK